MNIMMYSDHDARWLAALLASIAPETAAVKDGRLNCVETFQASVLFSNI